MSDSSIHSDHPKYRPKPPVQQQPLPPGQQQGAAVPGQPGAPGVTPPATQQNLPPGVQSQLVAQQTTQGKSATKGDQALVGGTSTNETATTTESTTGEAKAATPSPNLLRQPGLAGVSRQATGMASPSSAMGDGFFAAPDIPFPGSGIEGVSNMSEMMQYAAKGDPTAIIFLIETTLLTTFQASGQCASEMIHSLQIAQKQQTKTNIDNIQKYIDNVNKQEKITKAMGISNRVTGALNLVISLVVIIVLIVLVVISLFGGEAFDVALIPMLLAAILGFALALDQVCGSPVIGGLGSLLTKLFIKMGMSEQAAGIVGPLIIQLVVIVIMLALVLCGGISEAPEALESGVEVGETATETGTEVGSEAGSTASTAATTAETGVEAGSGVVSAASTITRLQQIASWAQRIEGYVQGVSGLAMSIAQFEAAQARYASERAEAEATEGEGLNEQYQAFVDIWTKSYEQIIKEWQDIFQSISKLIQRAGETGREIAKTTNV